MSNNPLPRRIRDRTKESFASLCPEQTETEDEYEKLRKGVYGVNLEDVWSPQSQVKKDHAEYHKHLEEAKTNHKEYNRLQRRAVARFKQDTKHDHKQANFHRSYSSGLFPEQHGELMEPVSKWEESGYNHANARADHLLQHPFGFQSVAIKNTHLKKTESVYRDHLQAQEAYNLHAQYAPDPASQLRDIKGHKVPGGYAAAGRDYRYDNQPPPGHYPSHDALPRQIHPDERNATPLKGIPSTVTANAGEKRKGLLDDGPRSTTRDDREGPRRRLHGSREDLSSHTMPRHAGPIANSHAHGREAPRRSTETQRREPSRRSRDTRPIDEPNRPRSRTDHWAPTRPSPVHSGRQEAPRRIRRFEAQSRHAEEPQRENRRRVEVEEEEERRGREEEGRYGSGWRDDERRYGEERWEWERGYGRR